MKWSFRHFGEGIGGAYLGGDVDLIDEADLLCDLFAGISGQVLFHQLQQALRLQLIAAPHSFSISLSDYLVRSQLRRFYHSIPERD